MITILLDRESIPFSKMPKRALVLAIGLDYYILVPKYKWRATLAKGLPREEAEGVVDAGVVVTIRDSASPLGHSWVAA